MTHQPRPAFAHTSGSDAPRIVLLGEAWGQTEDETKRPFAGESGKELFRMAGEAMPEIEPELHTRICQLHKYGGAWVKDRELWLAAAGLAMTNVLAFRPPGNKLDELCSPKKEAGDYAGSFAPLSRGKYLREEFLPELDRLQTELAGWSPNLVVAMGNTACWALLQATNIGSIRGSITQSDGCGTRRSARVLESSALGEGDSHQATDQLHSSLKVLPTYHPAGVMRQWAWRPIVIADLMKAHRESRFREVRRPQREVLVSPTLEEMEQWEQQTYRGFAEGRVSWLAPDVETAAKQITCCGFARSAREAMVIPFWDRTKPGYNYWPELWQEKRAFACMARLLESEIPKIFQNGLYDIQYFTINGIRPRNCHADTMLLHHSKFPEMQKGLGFLGSVYTNESSWKLLRKRKADTEKKDE